MSVVALPATPVTPIPRANGTPLRIATDPYADGDGDRLFEVVRGKRLEKNMGLLQNVIAMYLGTKLFNFTNDMLGHSVIEAMFHLPSSGDDRKPDVAFVSYAKWAKTRPIPQSNAWNVVPDLAVEVISPTDKAFDVMEKLRDYFDSGVQQVWHIYSNLRIVFIFESLTSVRLLCETDELNGDPVVPGFRMPVANLFPANRTTGKLTKGIAMTADEFWSLIESTRSKTDPEKHVDKLIETLAAGGEPMILDFSKWWFEFHGAAYSWDLWGAAYIMNGGCSDDGFTDFRSWLLLQGKTVYEAAMKDPESLAKLNVPADEASWECYPGPTAYEKATGKDADAFYAALEAKHGALKPQPELGEDWDFDDADEMSTRYPKLSALYAD